MSVYRKKMSKKASKKYYAKTIMKTHRINNAPSPMKRGGIRL